MFSRSPDHFIKVYELVQANDHHLTQDTTSHFWTQQLSGIILPIVSIGPVNSGKSSSNSILVAALADPKFIDPAVSYFNIGKGAKPHTKGIYACIIRYNQMKSNTKQLLDSLYGPSYQDEEKHVVIFDCQGSQAGDTQVSNMIEIAAISLAFKGILFICTSRLIQNTLVQLLLENHDMHKNHLARSTKASLKQVVFFLKDQYESNTSVTPESLTFKQEQHLSETISGKKLVEEVKPIIQTLRIPEKEEKEMLKSQNYTQNTPFFNDTITAFWNTLDYYKERLVSTQVHKLSELSRTLETTVRTLNEKFIDFQDIIDEKQGILARKFSHWLQYIHSGQHLQLKGMENMFGTIQEFFDQHCLKPLKEGLEYINEPAENVEKSVSHLTRACQHRLSDMYLLSRSNIKFLQLEYIRRVIEDPATLNNIQQSQVEWPQLENQEERNDIMHLDDAPQVFGSLDSLDLGTREALIEELRGLGKKYTIIPVDTLVEIVESPLMDRLFENIVNHCHLLYELVTVEYSRNRNKKYSKALVGFGTAMATIVALGITAVSLPITLVVAGAAGAAGGLGTGMLPFFRKKDGDKMRELSVVFQAEIAPKAHQTLMSKSQRWLTHTDEIRKRMLETYLDRLTLL